MVLRVLMTYGSWGNSSLLLFYFNVALCYRKAPSPCCYFNNKIFKKFKNFPVLAQFSLCKKLNLLNSLCFPCLEKLTAKFPVFPVPWPSCLSLEPRHAPHFQYQFPDTQLDVLAISRSCGMFVSTLHSQNETRKVC